MGTLARIGLRSNNAKAKHTNTLNKFSVVFFIKIQKEQSLLFYTMALKAGRQKCNIYINGFHSNRAVLSCNLLKPF